MTRSAVLQFVVVQKMCPQGLFLAFRQLLGWRGVLIKRNLKHAHALSFYNLDCYKTTPSLQDNLAEKGQWL